MKYKVIKIREHFLDLVRKNIKKNEYRLADKRYQDVAVGDIFVLVSNQDKNNYEKVIVKSIKKYKNWEDAFENRWEEDFKGQYDNLNSLLKECHKFYTKDEVDSNGIFVFEISLIDRKFENAAYLLDTNIIVQRESSNNVSKEVAITYNLIDKLHGTKYIHPKTIDELNQYKDETVRNNMLTKINAYNKLSTISNYDSFFNEIINQYKLDENSKIDNDILFQAYSGMIDFLITEDHGILSKAKQLYIDDIVMSPFDFLNLFEEKNPTLVDYNVLHVKKVKFSDLDVTNTFFDTLREDYDGIEFNNWFIKKSRNGEEAYVFENKDGLQGFLFLKVEDENEDYSHFEPILTPKKRLKVGTFKINSTGIRLGERFLKIIFDNARLQNVEEIYVTLFEDKRPEVKHLKELMEKWGFVKRGLNKNNHEIYLVKDFINYDENKEPKFNYPLIKKDCKYMFLPIYSQYHTRLFPDLYVRGENFNVYEDTAYRYAVEKIYITGWGKNNLKHSPGDLLFIYRMGDYYKTYTSVVTGIGILQDIRYPHTEDEFLRLCNNRSIFSESELRSFYRSGKYRTIVKVLYLDNFDNKINLKKMQNCGIIADGFGPRFTTVISSDKAHELMEIGGIE